MDVILLVSTSSDELNQVFAYDTAFLYTSSFAVVYFFIAADIPVKRPFFVNRSERKMSNMPCK